VFDQRAVAGDGRISNGGIVAGGGDAVLQAIRAIGALQVVAGKARRVHTEGPQTGGADSVRGAVVWLRDVGLVEPFSAHDAAGIGCAEKNSRGGADDGAGRR